MKIGIMAEDIVKQIFQYEKMNIPIDDSQVNLINILRNKGLLPKNIDKILYAIRKARNEAVHQNIRLLTKSKQLSGLVHTLCGWFVSVYGNFDFTAENLLNRKTKKILINY